MSNAEPYSGADAMAVRALYVTFLDFCFSLSDALRIANIDDFVAANVVKIESCWVRTVTAIGATARQLVGVEPIANPRHPIIGDLVDALPVSGLLQPSLAPTSPRLRGGFGSLGSRPSLAFSATILGRPFRQELSAAVQAKAGRRLNCFPRRHSARVSRVAYPCKPDIFEATYEAVS